MSQCALSRKQPRWPSACHCCASSDAHVFWDLLANPQRSTNKSARMPRPPDQTQKGNCTIHAILSDIAEIILEKYGIVIEYDRAEHNLTMLCKAANGSDPLTVLTQINTRDELRFHQEAGGSKDEFRIRATFNTGEDGKEIRDFDRLWRRMGESRKVLKCAVISMETEDQGSHAVAARGRYVSSSADTRVVFARNSWLGQEPYLDIDANNYLDHVEFDVEIVSTFEPMDDGYFLKAPPPLTERFKAALKEEEKLRQEKVRATAKEETLKQELLQAKHEIKRMKSERDAFADHIKQMTATESADKKAIKRLENEIRQAKMHTSATEPQKPPPPGLAQQAARKVLKQMTAANEAESEASKENKFLENEPRAAKMQAATKEAQKLLLPELAQEVAQVEGGGSQPSRVGRRQARDIDRVDGLNSEDEAGPALTLKTGRQPQKRNFFSPNGKVVDSGAVIEVDADQEQVEARGTQRKRRKSSSLNGASADDESNSEDETAAVLTPRKTRRQTKTRDFLSPNGCVVKWGEESYSSDTAC